MSKPTLKMTHGAIGEAMCCYTDGSYKDADIALTEYENSIRADERAKLLKEIDERSVCFQGEETFGKKTKVLLFTEEAFHLVFG